MSDRFDLDDGLRRLASSASTRVATPPRPAEIRRRGVRRHQRRVAMTVTAATLAVGAVGGIALQANRTTNSTPPVASPSATRSATAPELGPQSLVDVADVSYAFGSTGWRSVGPAGKPSPCEPTAGGSPAPVATAGQRFERGDGGYPVVREVVTLQADEAAARTAYDRALGNFTGCGRQPLPGATEAPAVDRTLAAVLAAGSEAQVLSVNTRIPVPGADNGYSTVAGVARVGLHVVVVTLEVTDQEVPPPYSVAALLRLAAARVTGAPVVRVPSEAFVPDPDGTYDAPFTQMLALNDNLDEICGSAAGGAYQFDEPGILAAASKESQRVWVYATEEQARRAVEALRPRGNCGLDQQGATSKDLPGAEEGTRWVTEVRAPDGTPSYLGAVRAGRAVALGIYVQPEDLTQERAAAQFADIAKRMTAAFG